MLDIAEYNTNLSKYQNTLKIIMMHPTLNKLLLVNARLRYIQNSVESVVYDLLPQSVSRYFRMLYSHQVYKN